MTYVFDIDGTLCTKTDGDYEMAMPIEHRIKKVNKLFSQGHTIVLLTARGMAARAILENTQQRCLKN